MEICWINFVNILLIMIHILILRILSKLLMQYIRLSAPLHVLGTILTLTSLS